MLFMVEPCDSVTTTVTAALARMLVVLRFLLTELHCYISYLLLHSYYFTAASTYVCATYFTIKFVTALRIHVAIYMYVCMCRF